MSLDFDTQIEFLLFDQEKIVTYKDIGNRFDIAPKEAQDVLKKFIANHKNSSKGDIHVVYLLTMENRENNNKKIQLANDNEVEKFEEDYKVISKQIYSIQLKPITDFNLIYSSDIDASNNVKRKMNITVIFDENEQENQLWDNAMINMITAPTTTTSQRVEDNKTGNKTTTKSTSSNEQNNILRPSKESNMDKKSTETTTTTAKTQEVVKVKDEPMIVEKEKKNDSSLVKKVKLESSEPSVTTTNIAAAKNQATTNTSSATAAAKSTSSTTSKKQPPAKSAQQPTLTSFFKKA